VRQILPCEWSFDPLGRLLLFLLNAPLQIDTQRVEYPFVCRLAKKPLFRRYKGSKSFEKK